MVCSLRLFQFRITRLQCSDCRNVTNLIGCPQSSRSTALSVRPILTYTVSSIWPRVCVRPYIRICIRIHTLIRIRIQSWVCDLEYVLQCNVHAAYRVMPSTACTQVLSRQTYKLQTEKRVSSIWYVLNVWPIISYFWWVRWYAKAFMGAYTIGQHVPIKWTLVNVFN